MKMYPYPNTIDKAAKTLDKIKPDWFKDVKNPIRMTNAQTCILGQVFGGYYDGLKYFSDIPRNANEDNIFGLYADKYDWTEEINNRKNQTKISGFGYEKALELMKEGKYVQRKTWGKYAHTISNGKIMNNSGGIAHPTGEEILSEDWQIYEPKVKFKDIPVGGKFLYDHIIKGKQIFQKIKVEGAMFNIILAEQTIGPTYTDIMPEETMLELVS